jgi:hypothetical protein
MTNAAGRGEKKKRTEIFQLWLWKAAVEVRDSTA